MAIGVISSTSMVALSPGMIISVPAGIYRGLVNDHDEEALMCVMLGASKPKIPTYPADHPLAKIDRSKKK